MGKLIEQTPMHPECPPYSCSNLMRVYEKPGVQKTSHDTNGVLCGHWFMRVESGGKKFTMEQPVPMTGVSGMERKLTRIHRYFRERVELELTADIDAANR